MTNQTVSPALQQIEAALQVTSGTFEKKITALFLTSPASPANSLLPTISTGWAPAAAEPVSRWWPPCPESNSSSTACYAAQHAVPRQFISQ
ncbi:hypothetical protein [Enterobacter sp. DE0047]|uniref:hypothetical protein n=1 Tax=Enterobacter sp. DE0047 TaxID=2584949 RepID=UPI00119DEDE3|nr:hypothetical protein [Enterobacter sp. DE0047]